MKPRRVSRLLLALPAALLIVAIAVYIFFWAVDSGQFENLDEASRAYESED